MAWGRADRLTTKSLSHKTSPRPSLNGLFRVRALLQVISTKALRGRLRLLLSLASCFWMLFLVLRLMPEELPNVRDIPASLLGVVRGNRASGGGLRVVVFGEYDIATPAVFKQAEDGGLAGWTELFCQLLGCSTYLSFIPKFGSTIHSMTSNDLYASAVNATLTRRSAAKGDISGRDYSFVASEYPVAWDLPDLSHQVTEFLSWPKSQHPPNETLWVFTLGSWDIWSLSSMPLEVSKPVVDSIMTYVFDQAERLYQHSLDTDSVAWSNSTRLFRVLLPTLFDPSLTPGWRRSRPEAPKGHSRTEQLRNAAQLTDYWNLRLGSTASAWVENGNPGGQHSDKPLFVTDAKPGFEKSLSAVIDGLAAEVGKKQSAGVGDASEGVTSAAATPVAQPTIAARPLRDCFRYDLPEYLLEVMVDRQFRASGLHGGDGFGNKTSGLAFTDVSTPCVAGCERQSDGLDCSGAATTNQTAWTSRNETDPESGHVESNGSDGDVPVVCDSPEEHLFYTPFTVSGPAIAEIARRAAEMVYRNESIRDFRANMYKSSKAKAAKQAAGMIPNLVTGKGTKSGSRPGLVGQVWFRVLLGSVCLLCAFCLWLCRNARELLGEDEDEHLENLKRC